MEKSLERFLHYLCVEKGFPESTTQAYRWDIGKGLIPFLKQRGKSSLKRVTRDDIRAYLDYLATVKGNSNATRARKLAAIKSLFNYLVANEGLKTNPAAQLASPKIPEKEPEYLTDEESIRLLRTIARDARPPVRERDMAMIVLFHHSGLRVSELTNLELTNVDLESRQMKITRKGNKEQYLHLNRETTAALANYLAQRPKTGNGRFFVGNAGGDLDRRYIYSLVRRYLKLAGIEKDKQGPHLLRHTFCTRLHQKGVALFTIKELAGHKQISTTMRYVRIENKEQAEAVDRLEFGIL